MYFNITHNKDINTIQKSEPMNSMKSTIIHIHEEENINNLVQIIEQAGKKLNIKTISQYAKDNNMSYNGVKNNRIFTKTK